MARDRDTNGDAAERSPLLGTNGNGHGHDDRGRKPKDSDASRWPSGKPTPLRLALTLFTIVILGNGSFGMFGIPSTRIVEDIVCRKYYGVALGDKGGPIDEKMCKKDAIQAELAFTLAIFWSLVPTISVIFSLPWGILADKIGRRPVLFITCFGFSLMMTAFALICAFSATLPIWLIWLTPAFMSIGGGVVTLQASMFSVFADVVPEATRSSWFLGFHVCGMLGLLIGPAVSGAIVQRFGPWPVMFAVPMILLFCGVLFWLGLPEQRRSTKIHRPGEGENGNEANGGEPHKGGSHLGSMWSHLKETLLLLRSRSLSLLILTALLPPCINAATSNFLSQFASKRYGVTIAETGYILLAYGVAHIVAAVLVLPAINAWLMRTAFKKRVIISQMPAPLIGEDVVTSVSEDEAAMLAEEAHQSGRRDLLLGLVSHGVVSAGCLFLAAAPNIPSLVGGLIFLSLGAGFNSYVRSLAALYVDSDHLTRVYSLMGMSEELGQMYAHPFLAELFSVGMGLQTRYGQSSPAVPWIGLPYFGVAMLALSGVLMLSAVRIPTEKIGDGEGGAGSSRGSTAVAS